MPTPLPQTEVPDYGRVIDAYRTGQQDFLAQKKRELMKEAGGLAAAGNMQGARSKLYSGGEFEEARAQSGEMRAGAQEQRAIQSHVRAMENDKLAKFGKTQELLGNMGQAILKHPNPAQALEQAKTILRARGLNADGVTLDQLPIMMQQNISVQQAIQNEQQERQIAAQAQQADRAKFESDRTYNNLISQQNAEREDKRYTPIPNKARLFDRQSKTFLDQPGANETDPETQVELGKYEQGLRKEWTSLTADNRATNDSISRMRLAGKDGSGAADVALIYSYMKMLDPNAAVMEGDYAKASNTGGIPAAIVNLYNKAIDGSFLTPEQRSNFLRMGESVAKDRSARFQKSRDQFAKAVKAGGADPSRVMLDEGEAEQLAPPPAMRMDLGGTASAQPPPEAIDMLTKNPSPEYRASFDKWFGPGAAKKQLGY